MAGLLLVAGPCLLYNCHLRAKTMGCPAVSMEQLPEQVNHYENRQTKKIPKKRYSGNHCIPLTGSTDLYRIHDCTPDSDLLFQHDIVERGL